MLKKIRIRNFQTHERLTVKLDPHITTITGPSDKGKSAILRALRWACLNKPDGDGFIRWDSKGARVRLEFEDGIVERGKGASNYYELNGQELVSFGRGAVPDLVSRFLCMGPDNFQRQHDPAFWFCESAPEVSRKLNAIVDLQVIDTSMSFAQKKTREAKAAVDVAKLNLDTSKSELESLAYVPDMVAEWETVTALDNQLDEKRTRIDRLDKLVDEGTNLHEAKENARQAKLEGDTLLESVTKQEQAELVLESLAEVLDSIVTAEEACLPLPDLTEVDNVRHLEDRYADSVSRGSSLKQLITSIYEQREVICQAHEKEKQARRQLPKTCPTCGVPTKT